MPLNELLRHYRKQILGVSHPTRSKLYRLSNMNQKERDKHVKAIASMIKAHLSVQ
ncbi:MULTISPECIES: hypothetical protein [Bacillaceae]|uniref:hypothetical protein n=1 Tax=Bacillaceae TaxID=186817 RepID=UPI00037AB657|nr:MULTISPECIES: hypothetical protein [Bacillaceae]